MNSILSKSVLLLLLSCLVWVASPAQAFNFTASERPNKGTAFFTMDKRSGQVYYMLDHHDDAGNWKKYGSTIGDLPGTGFLFVSNERASGTAFFAMESLTGQVYYMLDYGSEPGTWSKYGEPIGKAGYSFDANERPEQGTAFFAIENGSGQVYYMLDHGSKAGIWSAYGGTIPK